MHSPKSAKRSRLLATKSSGAKNKLLVGGLKGWGSKCPLFGSKRSAILESPPHRSWLRACPRVIYYRQYMDFHEEQHTCYSASTRKTQIQCLVLHAGYCGGGEMFSWINEKVTGWKVWVSCHLVVTNGIQGPDFGALVEIRGNASERIKGAASLKAPGFIF